ncbi:Pimelyl-[acyl-carrier protein] methyl ester esterase [Cardinium endosymbiont of Sogatella furcifera]|uniref:hypothetical protein n=1 Tax=Cardinium endosymbiont of Sogatella furcifera TaxID=650378 RepID=UPI000E0D495A|nr:hypothetical protein [Cardinium endosymbiont of Sogatella furcifera]AXI24641.1 Pimelyl-[acyl-carrier protein] methyl ester esterase [Cardinium endosymbiont of Sogatella furcifera]
MKPCFIFCHGWGFDHKFFEPLIKEYFSNLCCYCLDLGYFGKENLRLPSNNTLIGVGHSLGFIKLISLKVKFTALIGIHAFINFLGFDSELHKKRKLELKTMIKHFQITPIDTLASFHKRCGINYDISNCLNKIKLMKDLELLTAAYPLPDIPLLIIGSKNDTIVPTELVFDNFSKYVRVVVHNEGYHSLGLYGRHFVHEQIISFVDGISESTHKE